MLNGKNELTYKVIGCAMQEQTKIQFTAKSCKFMNSVNFDSDNYFGNRENGFILLIFNEIRSFQIADPYSIKGAGMQLATLNAVSAPAVSQHLWVYPEGRGMSLERMVCDGMPQDQDLIFIRVVKMDDGV